MIKNKLKTTFVIILAFTAAVCLASFLCSCKKDVSFAQRIIEAEKKSLEAEEYEMSCSFAMELNAGGISERFSAGVEWGEIIEENNKVQYYDVINGEKLYRTCGFDFTYSNYGNLLSVEKSSDAQIVARPEYSKLEDFDGAEITLEEIDGEYIYSAVFEKADILKQLENIPLENEDFEEFDWSGIEFGDEIIIKYHVNKDGFLFVTEVEDLKISVDIDGVKLDATMNLLLYIETNREKMDIREVGQCLKYAEYYTDEDKTVRWIENYKNPEKAQLDSDVDYVKGYKIENYGKQAGTVSGDRHTGKIAAASCDELELFSYVDIYDKDMRKIQTVCLRGVVNTVQINKNYISLNLTDHFFDGSYGITSVVVDLNDGKVISKNQFDESDRFYSAVLFGNAFAYGKSIVNLNEDRELKVYNIEKEALITPLFNGKPIKGAIEVNASGNLLVKTVCEDGMYLLEVNDLGEIIASRKKVTSTFGDWFIGKYWVGADYSESDKKVYYNAQEETLDIDIGEYEGNGQAQFLYIDDSYAVILDSADSGCLIYDFANKKYILKDNGWEHGIIDCHFYLGSKSWLISYNYENCIYVFGV